MQPQRQQRAGIRANRHKPGLTERSLPRRPGDQGDTQGDQAKGQTAMENCLQKAPDINLVYTINEPAAFGAYAALKAAGKEKNVIIVSIDGGCAGVQGIVDGQIAASAKAVWFT